MWRDGCGRVSVEGCMWEVSKCHPTRFFFFALPDCVRYTKQVEELPVDSLQNAETEGEGFEALNT